METYNSEKYIKEKINKMLNVFIILIVILVLITYFLLESLSFYHILILSGIIIAATVIFAIKLIKTVEEYEKYSAEFTTYYPKYPGYLSYQKVNYKKYLYLIIGIAIGYLIIVFTLKYGKHIGLMGTLAIFTIISFILKYFSGNIIKEREKASEISPEEAEKLMKELKSINESIKSFKERYLRIEIYTSILTGTPIFILILMLYLCAVLGFLKSFPGYMVYGIVGILTGLLSPLVLNLIYYKKPIPENVEKIPFYKKIYILFLSFFGFAGIAIIVFSIIPKSEFSDTISLIISFVFTYFYYKVAYRIGWKLAKEL